MTTVTTSEQALELILDDLRTQLVACGNHIRARGLTIADRYEDDELDDEAATVLFGIVNDDVRRLVDLPTRIDMPRAEIGVSRALERLTS